MLLRPATASTALQVLRSSLPEPRAARTSAGPSTVGGWTAGDAAAGPTGTTRALRGTDALFGPTAATSTQVKVALYRRVGEALGVDRADFDTDRAYASAVKGAFLSLQRQDGGAPAIAAIEHNLGLDRMGVSLATVVGAMSGDDADEKTLEAALARSGQAGNAHPASSLAFSDIGTYSVLRRGSAGNAA